MNELTLRINQNPGSIELNFEELEKQLDNKLAEFKGALFTEESADIGKKEVANLRKTKKDFEDARKAVKKKWMEPYDCFEEKMKKLTAKIDEPIDAINEQLSEFEKKRVAAKNKEISDLFDSFIKEIPEYAVYCPLEKIYDVRWENKTFKIKAVREDMEKRIHDVIMAVSTIKGMRSDKSEEALQQYLRGGSLPEALAMINNYEQDKAQILKRREEEKRAEEEQKRQQEIERIRREERAALVREEQIREEERARTEKAVAAAAIEEVCGFKSDELPFEQPNTVTAYYKVVATAEELEQVEMAFNSIGIYFERREV